MGTSASGPGAARLLRPSGFRKYTPTVAPKRPSHFREEPEPWPLPMAIRRLKEALDEIPSLSALNHRDLKFGAWLGRLREAVVRNWPTERLPDFAVSRMRMYNEPEVDGRDVNVYRRGLLQTEDLIERILKNERELAEARADSAVSELFLPPGSQHDAYQQIRHIVSGARSELIVVDNYLDSSIFSLLANLNPGTRVRLLTYAVPNDFALEARKFVQQYACALEIRRDRTDFHDRFIIRDGQVVYHLGHSIKDAGNKAMMIHRVEDQRNVLAAIQTFETTWNGATAFPI